jgi:hypothetical protein
MELAVPEDRVLLSDYDDWHFVLWRAFLPASAQEEATWDANMAQQGIDPRRMNPLPEPWESQMRASWESIFCVAAHRETSVVQATFECLAIEDVVAVTDFIVRQRVCSISGIKSTE